MKKFLTLLLATIMCFSLCSCGASNEEINKISEYVKGKSFYMFERDSKSKEEEPYYKDGKKMDGGSYYIVRYDEHLLTFNADGTADKIRYQAAELSTLFNAEQRKHSDIEESFEDGITTSHYDSYSIIKEDEDYVIKLYRDDIHQYTVQVSINEDGTYRFWYKGSNHVTMEETTTITSLPTRDYSE